MVAAAGGIAPAYAGMDKDSSVAGRRLAHLDVHIVVVARNLTRHSDYVECKEACRARQSR
jgi:hypothetical protein